MGPIDKSFFLLLYFARGHVYSEDCDGLEMEEE